MKPLFIKKNGTVSKVSGIIMNLIPSYTLAEYNALTHKPLLWVRTDEEYAQIPSTDVSYGSGSVKDSLDGLTNDIHGIKDSVNVSAENLDTYTAPGVYCVYLTSAVSPLTQGAVYVLEVLGIKFNNATLGFIQRLTSIYPNDAKIIQRAYYGAVGGWGAWREI